MYYCNSRVSFLLHFMESLCLNCHKALHGNLSCPAMGRATKTHPKVATQEPVGQTKMREVLSSSLPSPSSSVRKMQEQGFSIMERAEAKGKQHRLCSSWNSMQSHRIRKK